MYCITKQLKMRSCLAMLSLVFCCGLFPEIKPMTPWFLLEGGGQGGIYLLRPRIGKMYDLFRRHWWQHIYTSSGHPWIRLQGMLVSIFNLVIWDITMDSTKRDLWMIQWIVTVSHSLKLTACRLGGRGLE